MLQNLCLLTLLHPFIDEVWEGVEENQSSEEQKRRYEEDHEESAQKASGDDGTVVSNDMKLTRSFHIQKTSFP